MPKTIKHPKHQSRKFRTVTGGKSQGLRWKIIRAHKQSKGGMTVSEKIAKAIDKQATQGKALQGKIVYVLQKSKGGMSVGQITATLAKQHEQVKALKIRTQIAKLEEQLKSLNVVQVPKVILPELHDAGTGRIDAQKVADFMGVPLKQLSEGLGLNYKAVHRNPSIASFQKALMPVKSSLEYLQQAFQKPEIIRAWLNTPHPMLEGKTSLETILEGKAFAIERLLGNAWRGVVS